MSNNRHCIVIICIACVILIIAVSGCSSYGHNDPFFGKDKFYHFTASGIIGAGTTLAASQNGISDRNAPIVGIFVTMSMGSGKEYYDLNVKGTFWSWKDMFWDLAGGAAGCYLASE